MGTSNEIQIYRQLGQHPVHCKMFAAPLLDSSVSLMSTYYIMTSI